MLDAVEQASGGFLADARDAAILRVMHTTYAYLAGILDADGFITIQRTTKNRVAPSGHEWSPTYYTAKVGIAGTRDAPHRLALEVFGGSITTYKPANVNHRTTHQWNISGPKAGIVLRAVLPYLRVKHRQAELALDLVDLIHMQFEEIKRTLKPPYSVPPVMTAARHVLYEAVVDLNEPRNRGHGRLPETRSIHNCREDDRSLSISPRPIA